MTCGKEEEEMSCGLEMMNRFRGIWRVSTPMAAAGCGRIEKREEGILGSVTLHDKWDPCESVLRVTSRD